MKPCQKQLVGGRKKIPIRRDESLTSSPFFVKKFKENYNFSEKSQTVEATTQRTAFSLYIEKAAVLRQGRRSVHSPVITGYDRQTKACRGPSCVYLGRTIRFGGVSSCAICVRVCCLPYQAPILPP